MKHKLVLRPTVIGMRRGPGDAGPLPFTGGD